MTDRPDIPQSLAREAVALLEEGIRPAGNGLRPLMWAKDAENLLARIPKADPLKDAVRALDGYLSTVAPMSEAWSAIKSALDRPPLDRAELIADGRRAMRGDVWRWLENKWPGISHDLMCSGPKP